MWISVSEKYEASTDGHIRNKKTKRELKEFVGKDGYVRTQFDGKTRLIHRVIAFAFIESDVNKPFVNHKDEIKTNNNVENLEFCHNYYNQKYREEFGKASGHPVLAVNLTTLEVSRFRSQHDASRSLGLFNQNINFSILTK